MTNLDSILKSRDTTLPTKVDSQRYGFSSSHVWMWALDHKEGWAPKNWCFSTVLLEKALESPLDCLRSNQSILKDINTEYSLEGTDAEVPILWPSDMKSQFTRKDSEGKMKGGKMVGCHHWLTRYEYEQTTGDSKGQESLVCYSSWVTESRTRLGDSTTTVPHAFYFWYLFLFLCFFGCAGS